MADQEFLAGHKDVPREFSLHECLLSSGQIPRVTKERYQRKRKSVEDIRGGSFYLLSRPTEELPRLGAHTSGENFPRGDCVARAPACGMDAYVMVLLEVLRDREDGQVF